MRKEFPSLLPICRAQLPHPLATPRVEFSCRTSSDSRLGLGADLELDSLLGSKAVKVLVAHLCPTLCNSVDCSPPGSPAHEISQTRMLEWVHSLL